MEGSVKLLQVPKGWTRTKLGDIIEPSRENVQPTELKEVKYIGLEHIEKGTGKLVGCGYSREVRSTKTRFRRGDLLYGKLRPYLNKVYVADFDGVCSTDILVFPSSLASNRFLLYRLLGRDFVGFASQNVSGVQHPRVSFATLSRFELALPPLNEQDRIASRVEELFSCLDAGVASLLKVKTLLKRYRQAVLKCAFEGKLTEEWRKTHKDQIDTIKNPLGKTERESKVRRDVPEKVEIPEDLQQTSMPQSWSFFSVADLLRNGAFIDVKDGNHGTNHPKAGDFTSDGLPFITASQVIDFQIDYENAPKLKGRPLEKLKVGFSHPGDVVLSHKGTVGRVGICKQECVLSPQTTYYRTSADLIDRSFLAYFFASPLFQSQLAAVKSQTTRDFVSISKQYALFVVVPSILEQKEIVAEIDNRLPITRHIERIIDENLLGSQRLRRSILGSAFEGALVPQDPSDEPAENLLERIKAERAKSKGEKDTNKRRKNKPNQLELSSYVK